MAIFGFGKKKNDEPAKPTQVSASEAAERLKLAKAKASSVMKRKPTVQPAAHPSQPANASSASARMAKRPGAVKRPSIAVRPKTAEPSAKSAALEAESAQRKVRKSTPNKQIGQLLLSAGKINEQQLNKALGIQKEKGGSLGQILTGMELCNKGDIAAALKKQRTITTINLHTLKFDREALALLSREFCEKNRLIPFEVAGNQLCIAMSNALDTLAKNEVKEQTQMHIKIFDASNEDIQKAIQRQMSGAAEATAEPSLAEAAKKEIAQDPTQIVIEIPDEEDTTTGVSPELPNIEVIPDEIEIVEEELIAPPQAAPSPAPETGNQPELVIDIEPQEATLECSGGEMPSVGDIDDIVLAAHVAPVLSGAQQLRALPIAADFADEVLAGGRVDPLKLWERLHSGKGPIPAQLVF